MRKIREASLSIPGRRAAKKSGESGYLSKLSVNYIRKLLVIFSRVNLCAQIASSSASARIYSKYIVMASKEEFIAAVAFALSCVKQEHLVLRRKPSEVLRVYEGRDVFVWFPPGYSKLSVVKFSRTSAPPSKRIFTPRFSSLYY